MVVTVDAVFKALSDPTRRQLLDTLRDRGGLTLTQLEEGLGMTRFGVMKHLKVLEAANLVVTRRDGRFKHHYLNALPLQEVADRWMAPYAAAKPLARMVLNLKNALEEPRGMADKPDFVFETYIRTTPKALWNAITSPEMTRQYYYGGTVHCDKLSAGERFYYDGPDGKLILDGEIIEVVPEKKLVTTFVATWAPDGEPTRIMYEIEALGEACRLRVTHYDYEKSKAGIDTGWPIVLAGLKTLLETGKPLALPAM